MQNNYYFLKQLSKSINQNLVGKVLVECFSQDKDELLFGFCSKKNETQQSFFFIKANLSASFTCLTFPNDFKRANKNSVDLFHELIGLPVIGIHQCLNERAFICNFSSNKSITFKMFGIKSNIIFSENNIVKAIFQSKFKADYSLNLNNLDRKIDQSFAAFQHSKNPFKELFPTFGKEVINEIENKIENYNTLSINDLDKEGTFLWSTIQLCLDQLHSSSFYIKKLHNQTILSMLKEGGEILKQFDNPVQAINEFYYAFTHQNVFEVEKGIFLKDCENQIGKLKFSIAALHEKLNRLENGVKNEEIANIIMANMHQMPLSTISVDLFDFYRDAPLKIKLKKELNPQQNAENYYRKAKNEKLEVENILLNIAEKSDKIEVLNLTILELIEVENLKELRVFQKLKQKQAKPQAEIDSFPFKKETIDGWEIWIGRNAANNDLLTLKYSKKDDLWLHARDVAGSHVVIKQKSGQKFPKNVIERAAELAAYYSKRKTDSLCPVIVTPKKFVRKPKNLPAGKVIVDKEDVILVAPKG